MPKVYGEVATPVVVIAKIVPDVPTPTVVPYSLPSRPCDGTTDPGSAEAWPGKLYRLVTVWP